jgi:hypothetical protein
MENEPLGEFQSDRKIKIGLEHKYEAKAFFTLFKKFIFFYVLASSYFTQKQITDVILML